MKAALFLFTLTVFCTSVQAQTLRVGSDCAPLDPHVPDADVAHKAATGVNMHSANIPLDNITIPMELPLETYTNTSGINADLSDTRIRAGDIGVNLNTGTSSLNGHAITPQPVIHPDCPPDKRDTSIYSTK